MFEVLQGGLETTVQDYPGRLGYWNIGIPPSGPFDNLAFRLGNLLVGNSEGEAGLEITIMGPRLKFLKETVIAVTGADLSPMLNNNPIPMWKTVRVKEGDILSFGLCRSGCRAYLTIAGGIDVPPFFGSKSTYVQGGIGGFEGRKLMKGDIVKTGKPKLPLNKLEERSVKPDVIPKYPTEWELRVILGPQDDYLEDDFLVDMYVLGKYAWEVSPLFDRVGVRLEGPPHKWKPPEKRPPSGAHPSNINLVYCGMGIINVTGEVPVVCGVDGISLTGYTSVATLISADMWKLGQVKAGDKIRFKAVTLSEAKNAREELEKKITQDNIITS